VTINLTQQQEFFFFETAIFIQCIYIASLAGLLVVVVVERKTLTAHPCIDIHT
jgi:hypothetical protein